MTGSAAAMIALASLIVAFAACGDEASDGSLAYPALPAPPLVAPAARSAFGARLARSSPALAASP